MATERKDENRDDENNPLQSEILREVAEEMKDEQIKKFWKKISPVLTIIIIIILSATGGYEYYKHRQNQQALIEETRLQTALTLIQNGQTNEGADMLKNLRDSSNLGYRYLAALHYVDYLLQSGDYQGAVDGLNFIINDKSTPEALRNLAILNKVSIAVDLENPDYDALNADLDQLLKSEEAYAADALELSALIALRQKNYDKAKSDFSQIIAMPNVTEAKRLRATENLALLKKKMESEEVK